MLDMLKCVNMINYCIAIVVTCSINVVTAKFNKKSFSLVEKKILFDTKTGGTVHDLTKKKALS